MAPCVSGSICAPGTGGRLLFVLLAVAVAACSSSPAPPAGEGPSPGPPRTPDGRGAGRAGPCDLPSQDQAEMEEAWNLFVTRDPRWEEARERWLAKGPRAAQVLADNLFLHFWSASRANRRDEVGRVAMEAGRVGQPAVALWVKALVTDRWPLKKPVTVKVFNPDNVNQPLTRTFTHYDIDDVTRQHAMYVLAGIGEPAVPALSSPGVLHATLPSARRYAAYALGAIGSDAAVAALARVLQSSPDWRDRGAAAKGLGFALRRNPAARPHLTQALRDPDEFVRRKAQEGLAGKTTIEM